MNSLHPDLKQISNIARILILIFKSVYLYILTLYFAPLRSFAGVEFFMPLLDCASMRD